MPALFLMLAALASTPATFAANKLSEPLAIGLPFEDTKLSEGPSIILSSLIASLIQYAALIAVAVLIIAGVMMVVSYGDDTKVKTAKMAIVYALGGLVLTGAAYLIVSIVNRISL